MALVSPGVQVTVTDQSQYLPAAGPSVPFIMIATASNKANPNGVGLAQGTVPANAGKLYQVTSQRDVVTLFGNPFFYTTSDGTPIQGGELNEYGLLAAYSVMGATNNAYILRADIDLASLVGQTGRPTGAPNDGTYWLDTTTSTWGIYEWNATTQAFSYKTPIVITNTNQMTGLAPAASVGSIGDYAVVEVAATNSNPVTAQKTFWHKAPNNQWNVLGSGAWLIGVPAVTGTESNPTLTIGDTMTLSLSNGAEFTVTTTATTVASLASLINAIGIQGIAAAKNNSTGALEIYSTQVYGQEASMNNPLAQPNYVTISGTGTLLDDLGISAGTYNQPQVVFGTPAQMPLWQSGQTYPAPSGSVWVKLTTATNGLNPIVKSYNATTGAWLTRSCPLAESDWLATEALDATGGQAIPAGSVYAQYNYDGGLVNSPLYIWKRAATGPTVVVGNNTSPAFNSGPYTANVYVSTPGNTTLSGPYTITLGDNKVATDFVAAWSAADIPYTSAAVNDDGAIVLTHTEGGEIILDDYINNVSQGLFTEAGFIANTTDYCKTGPSATAVINCATTNLTGSGSGLQVTISTINSRVSVNATTFPAAGTGYAAGNTFKVLGTAIGGTSPANDITLKVLGVGAGGAVTRVGIMSSFAPIVYSVQLSNWEYVAYIPNEGAPTQEPASFTNWFWNVTDQVDIMVRSNVTDGATNSAWAGYRTVAYDANGFPKPVGTGTPSTDPNGPLISASEPTTQSDGSTALVYGDLWINTSDLENYPALYRYQQLKDKNGSPTDQNGWVRLDITDQTTSNGVLFADARWATNGTTNPANDPIPTIKSLLSSNYVDLDVPDSDNYPVGMLLFNTRRSGFNVKQYRKNYLTQSRFPDMPDPPGYPTETAAWVSSSGLQSNGAAYMGRKAQRNMVVKALRSTMDTNQAIRDEDNFFNLMATPYYPELQPNMVVLNADRGETGYILGDTPMGLPMDATAIQAWATNAAGATSTGEDGRVTQNTYLGMFYPSGIAPDLSGNLVAVPPSHMMLRTFVRNDTVAYPWFAAAGTTRGIIDNATNIGWLNRATGEFQTVKTPLGIRNVLYINFINPLVFFTGQGLLNYGNKTSFNSQSALDRTNVARLVAYIRRQLTLAARPFVFEPNDSITRQQIAGVIESLMVDLVAKRGIYDYVVQCDETNNTPARIDRNELWVDVAIEPVKAVEFIYIPVRILNTGELAAG